MASNEDRITDILHSMDSVDLLNVIRELQKKVGDEELLSVLEFRTKIKSSFDAKKVEEWASECADMDEREWYSIASHDSYGYYMDPGDHACEIIIDNLRDMFENDLKQIVLSGRTTDASKFLIAISKGLRRSEGILAEEAGDFITDFSDHLKECAESKDFDDAFEW